MKKLILFSCLLFLATACKKEDTSPLLDAVPKKKKVRYEIDCPGCFVVWYEQNEQQLNESGQTTGWFKELDVDVGFVALVAAHNQSGTPAAITARILVDNTLLKTQTTFCPISGVVLVTDTIK